jgi:formate-dependent nitrite reductase cytochrome c552 subunit
MFAGTGGSGVKNMPSAHSQAMPKKCVTCHMHREENEKEEKAGTPLQKGGHTFRSNEKVCLKCHEDPKPLVAEWRAETSSLLKRLKSLLDSTPSKTSESYKAAKLNYDIVIADGGVGAHNPKYAKALLQHSISSLAVESVWKR